ncbi:MAG: hypothetical protein JSV89_19165 [Spirochaetaceae bacterium]|nr:MAG: hypothetical protein JSV89_19165 [Spirochaetaceae bacterium]
MSRKITGRSRDAGHPTPLLRPLKADLAFKFRYIRNLLSGDYLVGENAHPDAGRGGTYKIGIWDEAAASEKSGRVIMAFHQACHSRVYNSTPRGRGNLFARLRFDQESTVKIVTLHWSAHPEKSQGLRKKAD